MGVCISTISQDLNKIGKKVRNLAVFHMNSAKVKGFETFDSASVKNRIINFLIEQCFFFLLRNVIYGNCRRPGQRFFREEASQHFPIDDMYFCFITILGHMTPGWNWRRSPTSYPILWYSHYVYFTFRPLTTTFKKFWQYFKPKHIPSKRTYDNYFNDLLTYKPLEIYRKSINNSTVKMHRFSGTHFYIGFVAEYWDAHRHFLLCEVNTMLDMKRRLQPPNGGVERLL